MAGGGNPSAGAGRLFFWRIKRGFAGENRRQFLLFYEKVLVLLTLLREKCKIKKVCGVICI